MPYKNKEDRLNYGRKYMKNKRGGVVVPEIVVPEIVVPLVVPEIVVPLVVPLVVPESPHHYIQWTRRVFKLHREFYKSAWFARWKYVLLIVHKELKEALM